MSVRKSEKVGSLKFEELSQFCNNNKKEEEKFLIVDINCILNILYIFLLPDKPQFQGEANKVSLCFVTVLHKYKQINFMRGWQKRKSHVFK